MNWLLLWYAACLTGALLAIHEPTPKKPAKPVQTPRIREPWIAQMLVYAENLKGLSDEPQHQQPQELIDAAAEQERQ